MKKFIALLLVFSMLTVFCAAAQAQDLTEKVGITEKDTFTLSVVPFGNENAEVNWWYSEVLGRYCLFFPAKTDLSALKLKCSENEISVQRRSVKILC